MTGSRPSECGMVFWDLKSRIEMKRAEIEQLRKMSVGLKGTNSDRVQASATGDKTGTIATRIVMAEDELAQLEKDYCRMLSEINRLIGTVTDTRERIDLTYRLVTQYSGTAVAEELSRLTGERISDRQERRIYNRAVQNLDCAGWTDDFAWLRRKTKEFLQKK